MAVVAATVAADVPLRLQRPATVAVEAEVGTLPAVVADSLTPPAAGTIADPTADDKFLWV